MKWHEPLHLHAPRQQPGLTCSQMILARRMRRVGLEKGRFDEQQIRPECQSFYPLGVRVMIPNVNNVSDFLPRLAAE